MSKDVDPSFQSRALKAIAEPHRRQILQALRASAKCCGTKGPGLCECDIQEKLSISQPTVSHHLAVLRDAGLIGTERRGHWVWHYRLEQRLQELLRFLNEQL